MAAGLAVGIAILGTGSALADPAETATASAVVDKTGATTATASTTGVTTRSDAQACSASECGPFAQIANSGPSLLVNPTENQAQAQTTSNGTGGTGVSLASFSAPTGSTLTGNVADAVANAGSAPASGNAANANASLVNNGVGTNNASSRANANGDGGKAVANGSTNVAIGVVLGASSSDAAATAQGGGSSEADATSNQIAGRTPAHSAADSAAASGGASAAIANANANSGAAAAIAQSQASGGGNSQAVANGTDATGIATSAANGGGAAARVNAIGDPAGSLLAIATGSATGDGMGTSDVNILAHSAGGSVTGVLAAGTSSEAGGGTASTNVLAVANGNGESLAVADSAVAHGGTALASNSATSLNGTLLGVDGLGRMQPNQASAAANDGGNAQAAIKADGSAPGFGGSGGNVVSNISDAQATGAGSLATADLSASVGRGSNVIEASLSAALATGGGIASSQLTETADEGGTNAGRLSATADAGAYASAQCETSTHETHATCTNTSQATGILGGRQSQAQTAAIDVGSRTIGPGTVDDQANTNLGAQAGSGGRASVVAESIDIVLPLQPGANPGGTGIPSPSSSKSTAGGCMVGVGCGIVTSQTSVSGTAASSFTNSTVTGFTTALNGHSVDGAGVATTQGGANTPQYDSSMVSAHPGTGFTFQTDVKTSPAGGDNASIASSTLRFGP